MVLVQVVAAGCETSICLFFRFKIALLNIVAAFRLKQEITHPFAVFTAFLSPPFTLFYIYILMNQNAALKKSSSLCNLKLVQATTATPHLKQCFCVYGEKFAHSTSVWPLFNEL